MWSLPPAADDVSESGMPRSIFSAALLKSMGVGLGAVWAPQALESWAVAACPEGVPKNTECIQVNAKAAYTSNKPAYNSEVFGRVRLPNGESALYGDFAEASDGACLASGLVIVLDQCRRGKLSAANA
jgi:hypothetical protein